MKGEFYASYVDPCSVAGGIGEAPNARERPPSLYGKAPKYADDGEDGKAGEIDENGNSEQEGQVGGNVEGH